MEKPDFYRNQLILIRVTKYFAEDSDPKVTTDNLRYDSKISSMHKVNKQAGGQAHMRKIHHKQSKSWRPN